MSLCNPVFDSAQIQRKKLQQSTKKKLKKEPLCYNITLPESLDSKHAVPCSKLKIKERDQ